MVGATSVAIWRQRSRLKSLLPLLLPLFIAVLATLVASCSDEGQAVALNGATMGTTWQVTVAAPPATLDRDTLERAIDAELDRINAQMSTWDDGSVLSRFNAFDGDDWFEVPPETLEVVEAAQALSALSAGAFDVTVGPLVNLWGFGADGVGRALPAEADVDAARRRIGYGKLQTRRDPPALRKTQGDLYVDLSAIAKGYAVDRLAGIAEDFGLANYLVEIGGELRTRGHNAHGEDWRIAIERPVPGERAVHRVLRISGEAVATSGDYRNFFEVDGQRYSHTIDPRTGRPVTHTLASVTVVHASALAADALATALSVLGPQDGVELAEREGIAALFVTHHGEALRETATAAFEGYR